MRTSTRPVALAAASAFAAVVVASTACRNGGDPSVVRLNGRLEAPMVDLAPKVAGRVVEVKVREGDRVKAGDLIARLDLGETGLAPERDARALQSAEARLNDMKGGSRAAEIRAAEEEVADRRAGVELAKPELERQEILLSKKVGTLRDLEIARTNLVRAQANLKMSQEKLLLAREGFRQFQTEQARADVSRAQTVLKQSESVAREAEIRAPADGVILHRMAEPGLLLGPGQPAVTLAFSNRLYVRTFIPEKQLGRVLSGSPAEVTVDAFPGKVFPARVTEISPDAEFTPKPVDTPRERVNLVYAAKVDLDAGWNAPLVPGQPADVRVKIAESPASPAK
ncbi:MAG: efflux RND transporter periplasmic adaptor subunit [Acidobacteriota bacterium]|nr:efflux RND transporter periplasmic adaptor subunit [Acidobacteriota bacterium]